MIVTCVYVQVLPDKINDFIEATMENHRNSVKEPGNIRFDLIQDIEDSTKFMIYEAYQSEGHAAEHKNTSHYAIWRDKVADWMAEPRKGVKYRILAPQTL